MAVELAVKKAHRYRYCFHQELDSPVEAAGNFGCGWCCLRSDWSCQDFANAAAGRWANFSFLGSRVLSGMSSLGAAGRGSASVVFFMRFIFTSMTKPAENT